MLPSRMQKMCWSPLWCLDGFTSTEMRTNRSQSKFTLRCFYRTEFFTANWLEARTIKYTNFPAKYMNSRSKLHWNIHVVLCQVGVAWNNRLGIGIPELRDHAEHHSTFNSSPKWILLIIYFYDIFLVFSPLMCCQQVYWYQTLPPNSP